MKSFFPALIFFSLLLSGQQAVPAGFRRIPEIMDNPELLYPFIVPDKKYEYWSVMRNHPDPDKAVIYESQMPDHLTLNDPAPEKGFFQHCTGEDCFSYLMACENGRTWYFATEQQLRSFIGTVDNLPEAMLIANTYGYVTDSSNPGRSSYKMEDRYISLYLTSIKKGPQSTESFLIRINRKTGKAEVKKQPE